MKRCLLILWLTVFTGVFAVEAQGQFYPASTPGFDFPNSVLVPSNSSAYSYDNLMVAGSPIDLCVYTWDDMSSGGAGMAFMENGVPFSASNVSFNDKTCLEAGILEDNNNVYIVLSYYSLSVQKYYLDLYTYALGGVLTLVSGGQLNLMGTSVPLGWIHLDVLDLNDFIVTWDENGKIMARAGTINPPFVGRTVILDNSSISLGAAAQPDVALINDSANGTIKAHFVYTNGLPHNRLVAATLPFNTILTNTIPLNPIAPIINDNLQIPVGEYKKPRIDAPDKFSEDDWSYVVEKIIPNQDLIFAGVMHNGTLSHYNLNDGSLASLVDISSNTINDVHQNIKPVVAYGFNGKDIYYCWKYYAQNNPLPYSPYHHAYIGLKIQNNGTVIGLQNKYWRVQRIVNVPRTPPNYATIALSGNNNYSLGLFMDFSQIAPSGTLNMTNKAVNWTQIGFRPGRQEGVTDQTHQQSIKIVPNPFTKTFQLSVKGQNEYQIFHFSLFDVSGKKVLNLKGTILSINAQLSRLDINRLSLGHYFLNLLNTKKEEKWTFKLEKIK